VLRKYTNQRDIVDIKSITIDHRNARSVHGPLALKKILTVFEKLTTIQWLERTSPANSQDLNFVERVARTIFRHIYKNTTAILKIPL
jgi:hypothetical protein